MTLHAPSDQEIKIITKRLILEPIIIGHAKEMLALLNSPELHVFIPSDPFKLEQLERRYKIWTNRISPEKDEIWLNWAAREKESGDVIGHFQAGVREDEDSYIAYIVGVDHQRQGYALEALTDILSLLRNKMKLNKVKAWIDTRNSASIELVKKLGMTHIKTIENADHFKGKSSDEYVFQVSL